MSMEHLSVTNAQKCILENVAVLGAESVKLEHSLGRVLAEDVRANRDLPPCDVSAMDGYAVRSSDLANTPASLVIIEDIKAGDMPTKTVQPGQCARIMTGAPVPEGADAVIRVEDTQAVPDDRVQINVAVKTGNDIRLQGEGMRNVRSRADSGDRDHARCGRGAGDGEMCTSPGVSPSACGDPVHRQRAGRHG